MTSTSLVGIVPPVVGLGTILPASSLPVVAAVNTPDVQSPMTPGSNDNSSSALDQAMAATLASIEIPATTNKEDKDGYYYYYIR